MDSARLRNARTRLGSLRPGRPERGRNQPEPGPLPLEWLRWMVVVLATLSLVSSATSGQYTYAAIVEDWPTVVLNYAALCVAPWRYWIGLALGAFPIINHFILGRTTGAVEIFMLLVLLTAYRRGVLLNLVFALLVPLWLIVHFPWAQLSQTYQICTAVIVVFAVCYLLPAGAGFAARVFARRHERAAARIAALEEHIDEIRRTERSGLARELVDLLETSLRANTQLLETVIASGTDPRATAVLSQVESSVRSSFSRLHDLVTTLRASEDDVAADLMTEIESLEDQLVRYGYTVELDLPAVDELPTDEAALLRHALDVCRERCLAAAPPLSTCHLGLTRHGLTWHQPLEDSSRRTAALDALRARAHRSGGTVEQSSTADDWRLTVNLARRAPAPRSRGLRAAVIALDQRISTAIPDPLRTLALMVPAAIAALAAALALSAWSSGQAWESSLSIALASASLAVATRVPRVGGFLLVVCVFGGLATLPFTGTNTILHGPFLAMFLLTGLVAAHRPRLAWLCLPASVVVDAVWKYPSIDATTLLLVDPIYLLVSLAAGGALHRVTSAHRLQLGVQHSLEDRRRRVVAEERRRLASEIHDLLAHQLALIAMRIGSRDHTAGPISTSFLAEIAEMNERARAEVATLTHALVTEGPDLSPPEPTSPTETAQVVAASILDAGHALVMEGVDPSLDDLEAPARHTLVRILREAGTNILRYAPPGAPCRITVSLSPASLAIEARNPLGPDTVRSPEATGWGLAGLRERINLVGGSLYAGADDDQWVLRAVLPLHDAGG